MTRYKSMIIAIILCFMSNLSFAEKDYMPSLVITDIDIPGLRDAVKEAYTPIQCQQEWPNASTETCDCLREALANNLNVKKLKLCKRSGNDECVATEFAAAKAALTEKQINRCKALTLTEPM